MTWPAPEAARSPAPRRGQAGFTLLEMVVVLVVLGLVGGLVLTRAPRRGGTADLRAATALVSGTLRVARSRAVLRNVAVSVRFDPRQDTLRLDADPVRRLPAGVRIASAAPPEIVFQPDGSATSGTVDLAGPANRARVSVSWLNGRIAVATGPAAP